jgi:hypothetical protein
MVAVNMLFRTAMLRSAPGIIPPALLVRVASALDMLRGLEHDLVAGGSRLSRRARDIRRPTPKHGEDIDTCLVPLNWKQKGYIIAGNRLAVDENIND